MKDWFVGIVLAIAVVNIGTLYYLHYQLDKKVDTQSSTVERIVVREPETELAESSSDQVEQTVGEISQAQSCAQDCQTEIARLEALIAQITPGTTQVIQQSVPSSASQSVKEITVALGSGEGQSKDWVDVPGANAWIDSNNYKNIASVTFEGTLQIPTENGWATARLYNKSGEHPVWNSEISAEEQAPQLRQSGEITLGNGNNLYQVQIKNTLGTRSIIESARVKILLR